jgi:hypothetical protein
MVLRRIAALAENLRIVGHPEQCASWVTILLAVLAVLDHVNYAVDFDDVRRGGTPASVN